MAFPTIPTVAAGRVLFQLATSPAGTHTSDDLSGLTKNAGDLLIAIVIIYDGNSTNAEFSAWGGGFTEFVDQATTTTMGIGAAYKWSTGSETGTISVTSADTSTNDSCFILLSIPGAHATTPPEGGTIANGTTAAADPGTFNPAGWDAEDTLWIAVGGSGEVSTTATYTGIASAPANYGDYADSGISADVAGGVEGAVAFRQLNAASEDVGTFSVDLSNARNSALVIAVRPAASDTADAELASGTGTSFQPSISIDTNAGHSAGTGEAFAATIATARDAQAGLSSGTGEAFAATASVSANAGLASGTGEAFNPTSAPIVLAGHAAGTGQAFDATAQTSSGANADAGLAAGTGEAFGPSVALEVPAGNAVGTGEAYVAAGSVAPTAGNAAGTGSAFDATADTGAAGTNANAGVAAGSGEAFGASIAIAANAGNAVGTGTAYQPGVSGGAIAWGSWSDIYCNAVTAAGTGHLPRKPGRRPRYRPLPLEPITGTVEAVIPASVVAIEGEVNDDEVVLEILASIL